MIHRITLGLAVTLVVATTSLHAQEINSSHHSSDPYLSAPLVSLNHPPTIGRISLNQPATHLASLAAPVTKPAPSSVRAAVLQGLSATVHDTDLARLNDIYSAR